MHTENASKWLHDHVFDTGNEAAERSTRVVMWITAAMMIVEIAAGWWYNSMALLADGWHMSSHAVAIGLSTLAYATARRYSKDARFAFGTWKIEILAGFASAIFLLGVAVMMLVGSVERLVSPQPIHYVEAIVIATLGLAVNVVCALLLGKAQHHDHGHSHGHDHGTHHGHDQHHDLNLKSAYLHVIADAATSVLAIAALFGGWVFGWSWLDPVMGIVGAVLVAVWAKGLIAETGKVLLDREMDHPVVDEIREVVETGADAGDTKVTDLHVWRVGKKVYSCAITVVTHDASLTAETVRDRLSVHEEIVHSTIEIHQCADATPGAGSETPPLLAGVSSGAH
ncbi:MAG: CDF family Co(II)/Ni(II) efflux transporter DmeF [Gammaproteobacteria bacterium]|jgi:cation diffusion facilitator family transporter|nr:CDF family Co(II)/Ni(II) efflux transporter DmeF [Gammaproteobacteria bacterium]